MINIQNHHPARITKADKYFAKRLDIKNLKFPVKTIDIHKIEQKKSIGNSVVGYENKKKYSIYVSKQCCEDKHADLLLIGEGEKNITFLSKISVDSCMIIHTSCKKASFLLLFTRFHYRKNIETSY